jgi:hypothetical protein
MRSQRDRSRVPADRRSFGVSFQPSEHLRRARAVVLRYRPATILAFLTAGMAR